MSSGGDLYGGVSYSLIQGNNMVIQKEGGRGRTKATGEAGSLVGKGAVKMGDRAEKVKPPGETSGPVKVKKAVKKSTRVMDPSKRTKIVSPVKAGSGQT